MSAQVEQISEIRRRRRDRSQPSPSCVWCDGPLRNGHECFCEKCVEGLTVSVVEAESGPPLTTVSLRALGYRIADEAWSTLGRCSFSHDEDATPAFLAALRASLARLGWKKHEAALRTFIDGAGGLIEIEPGGADCSGHYLHVMRGDAR